MRLRRWISAVAVLGVLLHAGALVRHHGVMLGALLQYEALVADLAAYCHSGADTSRAPADLPSIPKPSDAKSGCPICSGQSPAFAPPSAAQAGGSERVPVATSWRHVVDAAPANRHAVCPPARGPPALTRSV